MPGSRRGRPAAADGRDTRRALLIATRELLSENGFDRTTVRAVAAGAGVDVALVYHYFASKDELVIEALRPPVDTAAVFADLPRSSAAGPEFVRRAFCLWEEPEVLAHVMGVLKVAAVRADVAALVHHIPVSIVREALGDRVRPDDPDYRLALIAAQVAGLLMMRFVVRQPDVVATSIVDLAATLGPVVNHYLYDDLPRPSVRRDGMR